jgi:zinc-ribbon domain
MFCPNCGNQAADDQKFCRSCGMNLQKVAPALAEHLAEFETGPSEIESAIELRHRAVRRVILGGALMFAGIAVGIIGNMIIHNEEVSGAGALISITGAFLTVYFLFSAVYKSASAGRRLPPDAKISGAKTTAQLPPDRSVDVTPGITERTTDLLEKAAGQPEERKRSNELVA